MSAANRLKKIEELVQQDALRRDSQKRARDLEALTVDELRRLKALRMRLPPYGPEALKDLSDDDLLFIERVTRQCSENNQH